MSIMSSISSFFGSSRSSAPPAPVAEPEEPEPEETSSEGKSKLDLVFLCDCTGSMGSYISAAQQSITEIINTIKASDKTNVRFAVIGYEDHTDAQLLHQFEFTTSVKQAHTYVSKLYAGGGGDAPEAVEDALKAALDLKYRDDATKIVITVSDAPPHGLGNFNGDSYPQGCPLGVDPIAVVRQMVDKDIIIYTVGCEPALSSSTYSRAFFKTIATISGGRYVPLSDAQSLPKVIIFGAEEEIQLAKYKEEIEAEEKVVREELAKQKEEQGDKFVSKTDDEVIDIVSSRLAERGVKLDAMKITDQSGNDLKEKTKAEEEEDELVSLMSDLSTLAEVREMLQSRSPPAVSPLLPVAPVSTLYGRSAPPPMFGAPAMSSYAVSADFASFDESAAPVSISSAIPAMPMARSAAPPMPSAPASFAMSSKPAGYGYAQEKSSLNSEQVKRVMNRSKNKSSNRDFD